MRALISVSDKTGLIEFAKGLAGLGFELISTGGTHQALEAAGLSAIHISRVTGFPEILEGRVKTLHPAIHAGLLAKPTPEHQRELERQGIARISLLCVNLYPFRETLARGASFEECLEHIDIGGPAMLRAAAKNHAAVLPVCDPADYAAVLEALRNGITNDFRRRLAYKAFTHTAAYDAAIASWLEGEKFPPIKVLGLELKEDTPLRYGENPHQDAAIYRLEGQTGPVLDAQVLAGKPMGFNNYADAEAAWLLVQEFTQPACVAVKHANPCGVAVGETPKEAWERARDADTLSVFGGVVALNRPLDLETAQAMRGTFLEVVIAPAVGEEALEWYRAKKPDLRVLVAHPTRIGGLEYRPLVGGFLVQDRDLRSWGELAPRVVTRRVPSEAEWRDLEFAWKVGKHARSNNIVLAKDGVTVGIGTGAVSRIWAAERAILNAGAKARGAALASEAFFPFDDVVRAAAAAGVTAIVQPGGAKRDEEVIAAADELGVAMVFTGSRHFKH
ncbi:MULTISPECIES: bifunctional phosphoribosylaminoimidazolecarboxamide formyltransferase/IMP cyclohydrolase [unclassified Meiothermus]|uniref:bifunctional phosphoribosylaminoimidazolecarboxamide formyltransferase/IMP cyclohydrolase n=1 Tax=unclassified Meiothermus TaxID=370471 RepID=UPI000D7C648D|nr:MULTISPECIES: bifunctional phosphoribosylaminoimidazolecarboxamide formyltransferase/IMP cyclohydrolase [unclassified Meiothermus]PZA07747.1 bifunctional phosphoribosylaminoimidazolecarboxamide formyltransferase/inosine monophosphate cyclohydrolase [Meiothermus sp. Pnk-1]RYM38953.1 bifunctional phosphoribosylaminoimidazolecarboxamide formyltransferase/IMP cyclohydrolase [Meiothermus sp. PNK-Is4]